jgi:cytochrome c oxidase assembly factor CtaG
LADSDKSVRVGVRAARSPYNIRYLLAGVIGSLALLANPIDSIAETNLTVHMFQHLGLFISATVVGYELERIILFKLPSLRRKFFPGWKAFTSVMRFNSRTDGLVFAAAIPAIVFSYWHYPPTFDLAVTNGYVHVFEHLSYMIAGGFVGLSINALTRKTKIVLLYIGLMMLGMMGSMMIVWPSFYPVYSGVQNTDMETAMMLVGGIGIMAMSSWMLKAFDII